MGLITFFTLCTFFHKGKLYFFISLRLNFHAYVQNDVHVRFCLASFSGKFQELDTDMDLETDKNINMDMDMELILHMRL